MFSLYGLVAELIERFSALDNWEIAKLGNWEIENTLENWKTEKERNGRKNMASTVGRSVVWGGEF